MTPVLATLASLLLATGLGACGDSKGSTQDSATTAAVAATVPPGDPPKRPVLLMFHSGGFVFDDPAGLSSASDYAASVGFEPVVVDYPLANLPDAVEASERAARRYGRRGRAVYGYGESAGGTLAALLAEQGLVDAASTYSQVSDIPALIAAAPDPDFFRASLRATPRQIRRSSPDRGRSRVPLLALTPVDDDPAQNEATHRWANRDPNVKAVDVIGGHLGYGLDPSVYTSNEERAIDWLARRAG